MEEHTEITTRDLVEKSIRAHVTILLVRPSDD